MEYWLTPVHDFIKATPLRWIFYTRYRWIPAFFILVLVLGISVGGGWLIAEWGPIVAVAIALAMGYFLWTLRDIEVAYWGVLGMVTLLPFASLPFRVGFRPTFLDLVVLELFFVWIVPIALGYRPVSLKVLPIDAAVVIFIFLAIGAFVAGLSHAPLTSYLIRHFFEVLLSIALFFLVCDTVQNVGRLERLLRVFLLGAAAAAALGIILYFLPDETTIRILSVLGRVGYPTGSGVLRFIRDDPELMQRATSTSVDPNVLGSLLNIALGISIPQLFAERPLFKRGWLILMMGVMGVCLGLTVSRGSMVGAAAAILLLGLLRYRKVIPVLVVVFVLILIVPWTQGLVVHFIEGIQGQDLSTQMRFGEYKDALMLIKRYPILGVGFAGAPDIDTYIGVSNVYLLITEEMGIVGLLGFLTIIAMALFPFWKLRAQARLSSRLEPLWYGLYAAFFGGLVGGVFDHYFFSLDFHHSVTIFWMLLAFVVVATRMVERLTWDELETHPLALS